MITKTKKIRKRKFNLIFPIIIIIGFLALIGFLVISNLRMNQKRADLSARIESLKKEISDLETKNKEMKSGLSQAGEEGYIEKEARERLNLQKPGETAVVVVPQKEGEGQIEKTKNFFESLWESIKSKF